MMNRGAAIIIWYRISSFQRQFDELQNSSSLSSNSMQVLNYIQHIIRRMFDRAFAVECAWFSWYRKRTTTQHTTSTIIANELSSSFLELYNKWRGQKTSLSKNEKSIVYEPLASPCNSLPTQEIGIGRPTFGQMPSIGRCYELSFDCKEVKPWNNWDVPLPRNEYL